mgnify:CR=1 FL=1
MEQAWVGKNINAGRAAIRLPSDLGCCCQHADPVPVASQRAEALLLLLLLLLLLFALCLHCQPALAQRCDVYRLLVGLCLCLGGGTPTPHHEKQQEDCREGDAGRWVMRQVQAQYARCMCAPRQP